MTPCRAAAAPFPVGCGSVPGSPSDGLLESRLPETHEVRKHRVAPSWLAECWRRGGEHGWWQVYLNNFISCEVVGPGKLAQNGRVFFDQAHTGWESFGVLCALDKDVEAAGVAHELGAEIDGELGKVTCHCSAEFWNFFCSENLFSEIIFGLL